jgi:hypothetical protein
MSTNQMVGPIPLEQGDRRIRGTEYRLRTRTCAGPRMTSLFMLLGVPSLKEEGCKPPIR